MHLKITLEVSGKSSENNKSSTLAKAVFHSEFKESRPMDNRDQLSDTESVWTLSFYSKPSAHGELPRRCGWTGCEWPGRWAARPLTPGLSAGPARLG